MTETGLRTTAEIVERIREMRAAKGTDFFAVIGSALFACLPFEEAREFCKQGVTEEEFDATRTENTREGIVAEIRDYLPFAWGKANEERGLSAARSLDHMKAWLWLLGGEEARYGAEELTDYTHYGKPQLVWISERFFVDWRPLDNGRWSSTEGGPYREADEVLGRTKKR